MKSSKRVRSVAGKLALAAAGVVLAASTASAAPSSFWEKSEVTWPSSSNEAGPTGTTPTSRTDWAQPREHAVGATGGEVAGGSRSSRDDARSSPFPSSVSESAPWLTGRE